MWKEHDCKRTVQKSHISEFEELSWSLPIRVCDLHLPVNLSLKKWLQYDAIWKKKPKKQKKTKQNKTKQKQNKLLFAYLV